MKFFKYHYFLLRPFKNSLETSFLQIVLSLRSNHKHPLLIKVLQKFLNLSETQNTVAKVALPPPFSRNITWFIWKHHKMLETL